MDTLDTKPESGVPEQDPASAETPEAVRAERDRLLEEKLDLEDRLRRRAAEFDNFRKRAERERTEIAEYANTETVRALLPLLDDFERALKVDVPETDYTRGMALIHQRLADSLKKLGLEPMDAAGKQFDPHIHHAVEMVESADQEDHTILEEYQKGYNFRGRLLRPAMVKVAVKK